MRRVLNKFILKLLSVEHKEHRFQVSQELLYWARLFYLFPKLKNSKKKTYLTPLTTYRQIRRRVSTPSRKKILKMETLLESVYSIRNGIFLGRFIAVASKYYHFWITSPVLKFSNHTACTGDIRWIFGVRTEVQSADQCITALFDQMVKLKRNI